MVKQVVSTVLYRVLLPLVLLTAVIFRFNVFSFIYLLLMLLNPLLPGPHPENIRSGPPKKYLVAVLITSAVFSVAHIVFQTTELLIPGGYGSGYDYCEWKGRLLSFVGLNILTEVKALDAIRLIGLDFLVLFFTFGILVACNKLEPPPEAINPNPELEQSDTSRCVRRKGRRKHEVLHWAGEISVLILLAGAGIFHPSLSSAVYFVIFLAVCTWFACNQKLGQRYLKSKIPLAGFAALHFLIVYIYQLDYVQQYIPSESLSARLIGLPALVIPDCKNARTLAYQPLDWTIYISPVAILSLYWVLALIIKHQIISPARDEWVRTAPQMSRVDSKQSSHYSVGSLRRRRHSRRAASRGDDRTCLLDDDRTARNYQSTTSAEDVKETLAVDPNGSVIWTSESDMPAKMPDEGETATSGGLGSKFRKVSSPIVTALKLIARGSYVVTLIIMMTWSITYHSWLTFVLLLWSCILWMCPNSRQACLRSSPALVVYAEALLLLQYILGLKLNDSELPHFSKNIVQIGLKKYGDLTYQPLAFKMLYTLMFWITLRQFVEERQELSRRDISEGLMMQPFNISYCTTQPGFPRPPLRRHFSIAPSVTSPNPYIRLLAEIVYSFLVKYWIWVVAIMLMVISLGGDGVVVYRIVYMFLFLLFILMFQFSYQHWRKYMYGFWLTVIIFSMLVLILIYTYQFQDFDLYWAKYLKVPKNVQKDLGLELYDSDTGALFLRLLTPTFFLIITIIQLHYFHQEFLLISDIHYRSNECVADQSTLLTTVAYDESTQTHVTIDPENDSKADGEGLPKDTPTKAVVAGIPPSAPQTPTTPQKDDQDSTRAEREMVAVKVCLEQVFAKLTTGFYYVSELAWRFLELHIMKIVLFSVFVLACYDVCAIHFVFIVIVVVALPLNSLHTFFSHSCSVWVSVLLLTKMIYQLKISDYWNWQVNCTHVIGLNNTDFPYPFNDTIDIREWIGYKRTNYLADYCKGYIGLILVLTIEAVVKIRQKVNRLHLNEGEPKPGVLFPDATRAKADDSFLDCVKFLANFFFYKFGLEFCFVTTVACIGVRLDVFAVISAIWLCILFSLRRRTLAKIWSFYVAYQCIVLPIQYIMCVGLPPVLCLEYPWTTAMVGNLESLREWLFLPDYETPPSAYKIIADFFQLLFACCQLFVFRIETGPSADAYEGGSNKEIYYENDVAAIRNNPIPDFVTYTTSCLDMLKALIFFSFYWITLAVVFEAGTSRVNLFAMGYVIGCFYFLWTGNEFYLKPIRVLLQMWNVLLGYNIFVIVTKTLLQLIGCMFIDEMRKYCCPLVQLFGIACLKQVHNNNDPNNTCKTDADDAGIIVDGICFGFLLLQKRLFSSYYFQHLVNEIKAQQVLSSRGAELIHEIQMREVHDQQLSEKEIMEKIKKKMDRIRAYQQKIRKGDNMEPKTHFEAIRSGDYYMFDDGADEDIDLEISARHKRSSETDYDENIEVKEKGFHAVMDKVLKNKLRVAVEPRKESGELDDVEDSSHQSAIISADRDPMASSASEHTTYKSPDPLTITSSGPTMSLSLPSHQTPSTSRQEVTIVTPQDVKLEEEPKEETFVEKVKRWWGVLCIFMNGVLISATAKLNAISRDYRFVARKLSLEKKLLKEKFIHDGSFDMDEAEADMKSRDVDTLPGSSKDLKQSIVVSKKQSLDFLDSFELHPTPEGIDVAFHKTQPAWMKFFLACYYAAISRSELLCYIIIIINQIKSASILSLPLPLFVFLWGTLSVPRPSKAFWITIITYTEAIVVIKYLFQFYFFSWNNKPPIPNNPFYPPVIFGIKKDDNYAVYDLLVLMVVFFHRIMLKSLGLWKDTERTFLFPNEEATVLENNCVANEPLEAPDLSKAVVPAITKEAATSDEQLTDIKEECSEEESDSGTEDLEGKVNIQEIFEKICSPVRCFFHRLLNPKYRVTVDVYAFMFFCDFINFFIVVFGYWAFGTGGTENVTSYFEENKVPIPFLIMLVAQFALIVTDRALYLRKYILGKLIFQIILIVVVHLWMFFVLPAITLRDFNASSNLPPKLWYFTKCVYLLLSAYQIRSGYPTRILGNFFCKKYNYANLFLFKGYMIVPFLYEFRSLMDWIWTDTSMNITNWLKMEDIYANIFILKCTRRAEDAYPTPRGERRTALIKYGIGGSLLFLIILIIWFPLLLFALGNTVGRSNTPISCTIELGISGFEPLFRMTALQYQIQTFKQNQWDRLQEKVREIGDPVPTSFLSGYDKDDTVIIELSRNSTAIWSISPPSRTSLVNELRGDKELKMVLSWTFQRENISPDKNNEVRDKKELDLTKATELRRDLANMIDDNVNASIAKPMVAQLQNIFPNFIKVQGKGRAGVVDQFYVHNSSLSKQFFGDSPFRNLEITMWLLDPNNTWSTKWWEVQDYCSQENPSTNHIPYNLPGVNDCAYLRFIAFSDKAFPQELSILSAYGIVGLYTTFVLVVSRLIRGLVAGSSFVIMFDDMPYVDRVLQLCLDIYLVRESNEFTLEEDLFAKLIFLYRSPETLIKWTRPPDTEETEQPPQGYNP